ncbi:CYFA0S02e08724g1_1 [Cyberlindnera fabianii]|uniref:CYFA0S02e08724g1_1 n=1 Tax=Cyberlindnera fabianii TaxID=36022 RepID=A0A061AP54_CYBFA|nr:CYFA0S02e08724g1_1 [Cyberlindnera fabianii]
MAFTELQTTIYTAIKPILKIYFIIACGFALGRANILTTQTCKHISTLVVLMLLPTLIFSKIVTNIGIEDIKQVGIIVLVSVVLYLMGGIITWIIYFITNVPDVWFGGCLSAGLFPNVAELPIAYISTFNSFSDEEVEKGLSYVVMFLTTYCIIQFNFGGIVLIERDFDTERRHLEEEDMTIENTKANSKTTGVSKHTDVMNTSISRTTSIQSNRSHMSNIELRNADTEDISDMISTYHRDDLIEDEVPQWRQLLRFNPLTFIRFFALNLKRPMSIALIVALLCSLIPWLRGLFVNVRQVSYPTAPDAEPPLSFIMDFCDYMANACVPLGILVLGSTLSRLSLSGTTLRFWYTPVLICIGRVVVLPIIGVLFTDRLHQIGWFDNDRILHFVCAISWGLPSATSLIYLTAACADQDGPQMKYLAVVYIVQYAVLGVSLPFLATWTVMKSLSVN